MEPLSKLAQARIERDLTQAAVADYLAVDPATVCRWEKGANQPYPRHVKKLCTLFGKPAQELGLTPDLEETSLPSPFEYRSKENQVVSHAFTKFFHYDIELRLQCVIYDWLHRRKPEGFSTMLQYRLSQELEDYDSMTNEQQPKQNHEGVDIVRRNALRHMALLPIHALGLGTLSATITWAPEDILTHCAAGVTACEHLSKGQHEDMALAFSVLSTYLTPLKEIVDQSSMHRKEAARLVAQSLLIKATLSLHKEGPKRATSYGKQAVIYSKESENIPLQLAILKRLAWIYICDKQEKQALEMVLQAKSLLLKQKGLPIHASIQSSIYGGVAKYQARDGQEEDALVALNSAYDAFFASSRDDEATFYDDFNYSTLIFEDGLTYYYLEQYEKALSTFARAINLETLTPEVPTSSERMRIEIVNHQALASLKSPKKDMELAIKLWTAGISGAIALRSEQRFHEALTAFDIMQALWSGDKRIKELRELTRHW